MEEEHEWFGGVSSRDIVELDPISSHIPMSTQTGIQQARRRNYTYHSIGRERERERGMERAGSHTQMLTLSGRLLERRERFAQESDQYSQKTQRSPQTYEKTAYYGEETSD